MITRSGLARSTAAAMIGAFGADDPRETGFGQLFFQRPGAVFFGIDQQDGQGHRGGIMAPCAFFAKPDGLLWLIMTQAAEVG